MLLIRNGFPYLPELAKIHPTGKGVERSSSPATSRDDLTGCSSGAALEPGVVGEARVEGEPVNDARVPRDRVETTMRVVTPSRFVVEVDDRAFRQSVDGRDRLSPLALLREMCQYPQCSR